MPDNRPPGLFFTGTDTGVGKTYVAALVSMSLAAAGYRVGVYKPVASGCGRANEPTSRPQGVPIGQVNIDCDHVVSEDAVALWEAAGKPGELSRVCPQRFKAPLAPHLAARAEGKCVDRSLLRQGIEYWRKRSDILIVEGAGGLMSPVSNDDYVADLACEFGYPLVVVAANRIGAINQTLQTLIVAEHYRGGLPIAGIVLNDVADPVASDDPSRESNEEELRKRARWPVLARVDYRAEQIADCDWFSIAKGASAH